MFLEMVFPEWEIMSGLWWFSINFVSFLDDLVLTDMITLWGSVGAVG
jgi:hypothetical protein